MSPSPLALSRVACDRGVVYEDWLATSTEERRLGMSYDPDPDEVFYCGSCRRQQRPGDGERCRVCGKVTVSWRTGRESEDVARARWKQVNG